MGPHRELFTLAPKGLLQSSTSLEWAVSRYKRLVRGKQLVRWVHGTMVYHARVDVKTEQVRRLQATIEWATRLRASLQPLLDLQSEPVHFRPGSSGVAMIGLRPDRPQRGKSGLRNLDAVVAGFDALYATHCRDIEQGRVTGEKALQSFLIRESYTNGRRLHPLNEASKRSDAPVDLTFVTDEIPLPRADGKIVCDILALRRGGSRMVPAVVELKDDRQLSRLIEQVEGYSLLVDEHADLFARLFAALLGEEVRFDGPAEKWIVWPAAAPGKDPREDELAIRGIRVVSYTEREGGFQFHVGRSPS